MLSIDDRYVDVDNDVNGDAYGDVVEVDGVKNEGGDVYCVVLVYGDEVRHPEFKQYTLVFSVI